MSEQASAGSVPSVEPQFEDRQPPSWPKVIGIISLVFVGINLACLGCWASGPLLLGLAPQEVRDGLPPMISSPPLKQVAVMLGGGLMEIFLLVAGIALLARKPSARGMYLVYGVIGILLAIATTVVQVSVQADMAEWIKQNPDTDFAKGQQGAQGVIGQVIGWTFGLVFGFAWPLFCLIWFGAVKKKASDITEGKELLV